MPYRVTPIVFDQVYHICNRSIAKQPIFLQTSDYKRGLELTDFYRFDHLPMRFSYYKRMAVDQKEDFLLKRKSLYPKRVEILAYCLMPNHVHFLLRQLTEGGIKHFMSNFQESYAKYFNLRSGRTGGLFQSMFKAIRIEDDEQLLHVARYIHLNPVTAFVIKDFNVLQNYLWCSYKEYVSDNQSEVIDTAEIMSYFSSRADLIKFHSDQVDYQRRLDEIKHLILE